MVRVVQVWWINGQKFLVGGRCSALPTKNTEKLSDEKRSKGGILVVRVCSETESLKEAFPGKIGLTRESEFAPMVC